MWSGKISDSGMFRSMEQNAVLLRGAVFYISMSLWGIRKVENLDITYASVLPSIKQVLNTQSTVAGYKIFHFTNNA